MHLQNPQILTLLFLVLATCTSLFTLCPLAPPHASHLSPRAGLPVTPFQTPTCKSPSSDARTVTRFQTFSTSASDTFHIQCQRDLPIPFRCDTPDPSCALHTEPLRYRYLRSPRRKNRYPTPVTTTMSRNLPLRCERNCFCTDNGEVTCENDDKFHGAERAKRFVYRLENACRPICGCAKSPSRQRMAQGGEEVTSESRGLPLGGSESPPHRGAQRPSRWPFRSFRRPGPVVPRRAGFQSPPPEGSQSPPHSGQQSPARAESQSARRAGFQSPPPEEPRSPLQRGKQGPPRARFLSPLPDSPRGPSPFSPPSSPSQGAQKLEFHSPRRSGFQSPPPEARPSPAHREPRSPHGGPPAEATTSSKRRKSQNPRRAGL